MRLLVIDDNKDLTEAINDALSGQDIELKIINEGEAGLNEILNERGKYNLILLDIAMPEFSGYDVLQRLKKEDNLLKSENIVIFTASSITDRDIDEFVVAGAKGVLKKPVSLDQLTELVERYHG